MDQISARYAAAQALGLDPSTISWPSDRPVENMISARRALLPMEISDADWQALIRSGCLPHDPPQSQTMGRRVFVGAVLAVVGCTRRWTDLDPAVLSAEAVRRRFARWAHIGAWQRLASQGRLADLSQPMETGLRAVAHRAACLVRPSS